MPDILSQTITLQAGGRPMAAYVSTPKEMASGPGVVVAHHQFGLSVFTKGLVDRLAALGCAAICVDNYHHVPEDAPFAAKKESLRDSRILEDIGSAIDHLIGDPRIDRDRLAVMGHCMGGRTSFLAASQFRHFKGALAFYSGGMFVSRGNEGPTAFERLKDIRCPVIGFFGAEDKNPSAVDVVKIDAELTRCAIRHEFHSYAGAGHGFCNADDTAHYNAAAATDSWKRTLDFLAAQIGLAVS